MNTPSHKDPFRTALYRAVYTLKEQRVYRLHDGSLVATSADKPPEGGTLIQRVTATFEAAKGLM